MNRLILLVTLLLLTTSLSGCAGMLWPHERKGGPMALPGEYDASGGDGAQALPKAWWRAFESEELNTLVETALRGNFDVQTAWARLRQARAASVISDADMYPTLNLEGSAQGDRGYSQTTSEDKGTYTEGESYGIGLAASYEVDLWGKFLFKSESASLEAEAAGYDVSAAAMTVTGEVATNWVDLLAARAEMKILLDQIDVNSKQLDLQVLRFKYGQATALDVSQQRELLASTRSEMPLLQSQARVLENEIAFLVGRSSPEFIQITQEDLPQLIDLPETGLPVQLLTNRPDVRAALARLKAGDFDVASARADRLPSISLSASDMFQSNNIGYILDNWAQQIAGSLLGPIIDGGARAAEVRRQRALVDEYMTDYARVVATAVQEVQNALIQEKRQGEYVALLEDQLKAAKQARIQARLRYLQGQDDYLPLLTEMVNVQDLERKLVAERANRITYRIALYRSLGGDWTDRLTPDGYVDAAGDSIRLVMGADYKGGSRQ